MKKKGLLTLLILCLLILGPVETAKAAEYTITSYETSGTVVVDAPIYALPDENGTIAMAVPVGTTLTITGITSNGWYQLNISGIVCYTPVGFIAEANATNTTAGTQTQNLSTYTPTTLQESASYTINQTSEITSYLNDAFLKHANSISITSPVKGVGDSIYSYLGTFLHSSDVKSYYQGNIFGYSMSVSGYMYGSSYEESIKINVVYGDSISEEAYVENTVAGLVPNMLAQGSTYNQIKAVHDYVCNSADYDWNYTRTDTGYLYNSAYDCLANGKSVCSGYALLFQKFMEQMGIPSYYVATENHAWNIVCVDGVWYQIDCTWDGQDGGIRYDYFLFGYDGEHPYSGSIAISGTRHS